jgi:hypothetical protein
MTGKKREYSNHRLSRRTLPHYDGGVSQNKNTNLHRIRAARRRVTRVMNWLAWPYELGAALARCWPVLLMLVLGPAVLALVPQGRQALFVAGAGADAGLLGMYMYGTALLAIGIYPMMLLDTARKRTTRAWLYAKYTAPQLVAATTAYALPLLLRYWSDLEFDPAQPGGEANAALGGMSVLIEFVAVAAVCVPAGMMTQDAKSKQAGQVIASLFVIGLAWAIPFIFFDWRWMFTRYACLIAGIVIANVVFSGAYEFAHARRKLLKILAAVLLVFAVITLWITIRLAVAPGERATWWGPFSVVVIAMLGWLSIAYIIDWILWQLAWCPLLRLPRPALGVLRFAVFALIAARLATGAFGNTKVDALPVADAGQAPLAAYLDSWLKERKPKPAAPPYPVFIVTAEGGGIRAAYWTANVLAALHDANPKFADHVLALSGVSGGSMGTSVYAALAAGGDTAPACKKDGRVQACAQAIGGADLLSAPLAAMLLSEPFNRITARIPGADRAAALDHALEHAWLATMGDDRFTASFDGFAARRMLVLPNATSADTAQRVVITPLAAKKEFADALTLDGRAFSFSTATLLSARFPGLSPAGVYTPRDGEPLRIVDGGFADNSGTATGADVLGALNAAIDRIKARGRFTPVVIAISNGSEVIEKSLIDALRPMTLGMALDPVATLESVRVSTSKRYEAALKARVEAQKGQYLTIRLLHRKDEFPLGWMLAPTTTDAMNKRLQALNDDANSEFRRVGALLER